MKEKGFSKDFIMVVIGQIISLFGNAAPGLRSHYICSIRPGRRHSMAL